MKKDKDHFSYFSFDSSTGSLRWKHEQNDFQNQKEIHEIHDKVEMKTNIKHSGEINWRQYKSDILRNLPHTFRFNDDFRMKIDHFTPEMKKIYRKPSLKHEMVIIPSIGKVLKDSIPNVLISYLDDGMEVIHLYTGRTITQLGPLPKERTYIDLNDNGVIDAVSTSLDNPCNGKIESGIPNNHEDIFSTSLCKMESLLSRFSIRTLEENVENVKSIPPCVVERFESFSSNKKVKDIIFYVGNGIVTSLSHDKGTQFKENWRVQTPSVVCFLFLLNESV
jgi:hypothetical protein